MSFDIFGEIVLKNRYKLETAPIEVKFNSDIYRAEDDRTYKIIALKRIKIKKDLNDEESHNILKEAFIISKINHINIATYYETFLSLISNIYYLCIVTDFYNEGTLRNYIDEQKHTNTINDEIVVLKFFQQAILGVKYLHENNIVHRNIKPENIFIKNGILKLGDFGLFLSGTNSITTNNEISNYDYKCDVWSLGNTLYELILLEIQTSSNGSLEEISNGSNGSLEEISYEFKNIFKKMLEIDCLNRANIFEIDSLMLDIDINLNYNNHFLWKKIGNKYFYDKNYNAALDAYNKAIELKSDYVNAWINKGMTLVKLEKYDDAFDSYIQAIEINPDSCVAWNAIGCLCDDIEMYDHAIIAFDKAININPYYDEAFNNLGVTYANIKKSFKSIEAFNKAIEINPNMYDAWNNLGVLYYNSYNSYNSYNKIKAINAYNTAIDIKPDYFEAWFNKGILLMDKDDSYTNAIISFKKAIRIDPNNFYAWYYLGCTFYSSNDYTNALDVFNTALYNNLKNDKISLINLLGKMKIIIRKCFNLDFDTDLYLYKTTK